MTTAGEVMFATASTPTHLVFNGLPHMNRAYFRRRRQYQKRPRARWWAQNPRGMRVRVRRFAGRATSGY